MRVVFKSLFWKISIVATIVLMTACNKNDEMDLFLKQPAPQLSITETVDGVELSWTRVDGADLYVINRGICENFQGCLYDIFESRHPDRTTFTDTDPIEDISYYRVFAWKCKGRDYCETTGYSNTVSISYKRN